VSAHDGGGARGTEGGSVLSARRAQGERERGEGGSEAEAASWRSRSPLGLTGGAKAGVRSPPRAHAAVAA
jgi:hypothetical protein